MNTPEIPAGEAPDLDHLPDLIDTGVPKNIHLSSIASAKLNQVRHLLDEHPLWLQALSYSVMIEWLCDYWLYQGDFLIAKFKPLTERPGRKVDYAPFKLTDETVRDSRIPKSD